MVITLGLGSTLLGHAQETLDAEGLRRKVVELQQTFERARREHQAQIDALRKQIDALQGSPGQASSASAAKPSLAATIPPGTTNPNSSASSSAESSSDKRWRPGDPLRLGGPGRSYLDLSVVGTLAAGGSTANDLDALQLGGHDPKQRGFTLQALETTFTGMVDPYFRGQANVAFQLDSSGETGVELEEAFLETISLPGNLQFKAGQFLTEFGRHNPTHPHSWAFVDQPLVMGRLLGPDGLRNPGARLSWLVPTPFYSELFLAVQNSQGETATSFLNSNEGERLFGREVSEGSIQSFADLIFAPRYAMSFELTDNQTLLSGLSAAFGPNGSGTDTRTEIYGTDLTWKWKSPRHEGGFPFVAWQTEFLLRRYQAGASDLDFDADGVIDLSLPEERLVDYGFYSQLSYGFTRGWVAGLRGDYSSGDEAAWSPDLDRATRWRISPNLSWFPTEFSKVRLQYNHDRREQVGTDHSIWLQLEFLLGAHAAHKF